MSRLIYAVSWIIIILPPPNWLNVTMDVRELAKYVVGGFFFISGYGIASTEGVPSFGKLTYRLKKILIPFIWFLMIFQLILIGVSEFDLTRIMTDLLCGSTPFLLPNCWFVFVLSAFYVAMYAQTVMTKNKLIRCILLFVFSIVIIGILYIVGFQTHWYISTLAVPVGYLCACYRSMLSNLLMKKTILATLGMCALVLVYLSSFKPIINLILIPLVSIISTLLVVSFGKLKSRILGFLGTISYEIYLSHGIVLYCLGACAINNIIIVILLTMFATIPLSAISRLVLNAINIK